MKEKISEFKPGTTEEIVLLLMNVEEKTTRSGSTYVTLTLTDGEQIISGNMFSKKAEEIDPIGSVVKVKLEAKLYNDICVFNVHSCCYTGENPEKYIPHAPIPAERMYAEIHGFASNSLGPYARITTALLEEYKETLLLWTAAKKVHHNIRGGLLYHMYRMLKTAIYVAGCYRFLDKNLLCAGVILHDIGKVKELECDEFGATDYSVDGNLFGHLFLGAELIGQYAEKTGLPEEETRLLKHMIVSHHGKMEYGAIRIPAIPEASILFHIDGMDAEMYQYEEVQKNMEPGTTSDLIFGLNTRVYNRTSKLSEL